MKMLLKCSMMDKRPRMGTSAKGKHGRGTAMKMTMSTGSTMTPRIHRKTPRIASKRYPGKMHVPGKLHQTGKLYSSGKGGAAHHPGKLQAMSRGKAPQNVETSCDNSNDSGFGFDQHMEITRNRIPAAVPAHRTMPRAQALRRPLVMQHSNVSRNGKVQLQILCQPETQHRARYQTEGSRGAVKDEDQHGFPVIQLIGYNKPAVLQVFIGTDTGRVAPHMFYQACRVSGKNSTPCTEEKIAGTLVIKIELDPAKDMKVVCDCVGILKERNVDVEHRFPDQTGSRGKKKSTFCRMVFRTVIQNDDNTTETLQVCSREISCTQPPGTPEISKLSLVSGPATGGSELFILGKNFLKNTQVVFENCRGPNEHEFVTPIREFLQQIHLVCIVPPYYKQDIHEPVRVRLCVISGKDDQSRKSSEGYEFTYIPVNGNSRFFGDSATLQNGLSLCGDATNRLGNRFSSDEQPRPVMLWSSEFKPKAELDVNMMPPPAPLLSFGQRRSSTSNLILPDRHTPPMTSMKTEIMDENSQGSDSKFHITNDNSMDSMDSVSIMRHSEMLRNLNVMNDNSNMSVINENSMEACRSFVSHNEDPMHSLLPVQMLAHSLQNANSEGNNSNNLMTPSQLSPQDSKGIDLRVKASDLSQTQASSLATLSQFVPTGTMPSQSAQSVERYLSKLETSGAKSLVDTVCDSSCSNMSQHLQMQKESFNKTDQIIQSVTAAVFNRPPIANTNEVLFSSSEPNVPSISQIDASLNQLNQMLPHSDHTNGIMQIGGTNLASHLLEHNSISATIANSLMNESQQNDPANLTRMFNQTSKETLVMDTTSAALLTSTQGTAKLDALVNSAVETHIGSPPHPPTTIQSLALTSDEDTMLKQTSPVSNMHHNLNITTVPQDIIMGSQQNPNEMILTPSTNQSTSSNHNSPTDHDIILNAQVQPNMMCQNALTTNNVMLEILNNTSQDMAVSMSNIMNNPSILQPSTDVHMAAKSPEVAVKNMILNAAAEILTSQQAPITPETTMNALMTSATMLNENAAGQSNQPPLIITQAPSVPQTELQQQTDQQRISDALCQNNQQSGSLMDQHIIMNQQSCLGASMLANDVQQMLNASQPGQGQHQYNVTTDQTTQAMLNNVPLPNIVSSMVTCRQMNADNSQTFQRNQPAAHDPNTDQMLRQELHNAVNQQLQLNYNEAVNQEIRNAGTAFSVMTDSDLLRYIDPTSFDHVPPLP